MDSTKGGFTLAELLVAVAILLILVLLISRMVNSATAIISHGTKRMEIESHARPVFDRLATDIAQMVKRNDVSIYLKNAAASEMGSGAIGQNDRLAFFAAAPGFYDNSVSFDSGYSVIAYRVNTDPASAAYNRLERMAKGLPLSAAYNAPPASTSANNSILPLLFVNNISPAGYTTTIDGYWPAATRASPDPNYYSSDPYQRYELVGPQVFRFEYYFLTRGSTATLVAYPTSNFKDTTLNWGSSNTVNIKDVSAIVIAIAALDPQSKKLLTDAQVSSLITRLPNYSAGGPGALLQQWQSALDGITDMPRPALQGIRLYERYFYISQ